jgi:DNA-binding GntR family transcriptional regulator
MTATSPSAGKRTLADEAYSRLKSRIMRSELAPGAKLSIDGLAKQLAFSHTPIREALARLESEGLLARRPLSGYTVEPLLSATEFADLFEIRMLLEPLAARRAAERALLEAPGGIGGSEAGVERIASATGGVEPTAETSAARRLAAASGGNRSAADLITARRLAAPGGGNEPVAGSATSRHDVNATAARSGVTALQGIGGFAEEMAALRDRARTPEPSADKLDFTEADARFHNAVAQLSGSVQLEKAIRRLDAHLHLHRAYIEPESIGETEVEHLAVAEAIIAQQPLAAEESMRRHLERSRIRHRVAFEGIEMTAPNDRQSRREATADRRRAAAATRVGTARPASRVRSRFVPGLRTCGRTKEEVSPPCRA